jgi:serine/threonine protein kinase
MQTKNKLRNYEIQTRLGSGSYGVIFKALSKTDKQLCVLKQIRMNKMSEKAKKSV